ncbi:MAG: hypothetical protein ABIP68_00050, partial [Ferruginibacter sp.]
MKAILPSPTRKFSALGRAILKLFVTTCILLYATSVAFSQINMSNTNVNGVCSGLYYDQGGTLNYSNGITRIQTFTPSPGSRMTFDFTSFATESGYDFLYIYNGNSTAAPLIGTYSG